MKCWIIKSVVVVNVGLGLSGALGIAYSLENCEFVGIVTTVIFV